MKKRYLIKMCIRDRIWAIGASILALIGGFVAVYLTYREKEEKKITPQLKSDVCMEIVSPMNGKVIALEEVEDEVFKGESLGPVSYTHLLSLI